MQIKTNKNTNKSLEKLFLVCFPHVFIIQLYDMYSNEQNPFHLLSQFRKLNTAEIYLYVQFDGMSNKYIEISDITAKTTVQIIV